MVKKKWKVLSKSREGSDGKDIEELIEILLQNRGIKTPKEREAFFEPTHPSKIKIRELGISDKSIQSVIGRIKIALENKERVIIYGDYDADGVCATAILWETLYTLGVDVTPYIPNRFDEGYGINAMSIENIKIQNPNIKLVITVDNGIVAHKGIDKAKELGIDVIVTDHHQKGDKRLKTKYLIHTTKICGSAIAWFLSREIIQSLSAIRFPLTANLELAAIGTIADIIPLKDINRSIVKHGLFELNQTKRIGLLEMIKEGGLVGKQIGTYEVGYILAPRINAMGRMSDALTSLRLLCTKNKTKAEELAQLLGKTNKERQTVVESVSLHAENVFSEGKTKNGAILLAHESYHEGVIGLAAADLVRKYYRPAIIFSKGKEMSKASARSIHGFNIIEAIRKFDDLIEGGGGHPMAAGFSIQTSRIEEFTGRFIEFSKGVLTPKILTKVLEIDCEIDLASITQEFFAKLKQFDPTGIGNPTPLFVSKVAIKDIKSLGREGKHLKLKVSDFSMGSVFDAIAFGMGSSAENLQAGQQVKIAYTIDENIWNGDRNLQLFVKDIASDN